VIYSREDLSVGLVGQAVDGIVGYSPATATSLMTRILNSVVPLPPVTPKVNVAEKQPEKKDTKKAEPKPEEKPKPAPKPASTKEKSKGNNLIDQPSLGSAS